MCYTRTDKAFILWYNKEINGECERVKSIGGFMKFKIKEITIIKKGYTKGKIVEKKEKRYVIIDDTTGEVINTFQGEGYLSYNYARAKLKGIISKDGKSIDVYQHLRFLPKELQEYAISFAEKTGRSIIYTMVYMMKNQPNSGVDEENRKHKMLYIFYGTYNISFQDKEKCRKIYDLYLESISEKNKAAFDFGLSNDMQKEAIEETEGPVMIIAGPGTGKTSTLVRRVLYLIQVKNVKPEEIMLVTFTNKAAAELVTKITNILPDININEMYIGTIHQVMQRIFLDHLEKTNIRKNYKTLEGFEQRYLVYTNLSKFEKNDSYEALDLIRADGRKMKPWVRVDKIIGFISSIKEELIDIERLKQSQDKQLLAVVDLMQAYEALLEKYNLIDFSDMLLESYLLFKNYPEVLNEVQSKLSYIMVDEYQDTNYIQEQLMLMLAGEKQNICVVGDDDQSLYRFRGATVSNILNFSKRFDDKKCREIYFQDNYRSEKSIVEFYNNWMNDEEKGEAGKFFRWGEDRFAKNIHACRSSNPGDVRVVKCSGDNNPEQWYEEIYQLIKYLEEKKIITDYNQVAFLAKTVKTQGVKIYDDMIAYLEQRGIPVYAPRFGMYFERKEVKELIGCLLNCFSEYAESLVRNEVKFLLSGLRAYYLECMEIASQIQNNELQTFIREKSIEIKNHNIKDGREITKTIYQLLAYDPFYSYVDVVIGNGIAGERPARNISKFIEYTNGYENVFNFDPIANDKNLVDNFFSRYLARIRDVGIEEYQDDSEYAPRNCISFMNFHQSKGMEFPVVIVSSLNQTPWISEHDINVKLEKYYHREKSESKENISKYDFWRAYYTAFSRAQNLLVLSCNECQYKGNVAPSECFEELYGSLKSYKDVDLSSIEALEVKPVQLKPMYSFTTHVGMYQNCPLQYKFFKELKFTAIRNAGAFVGSLVHETIEDYHKEVLDKKSGDVEESKIREWFDNNYDTLSKKEHTYLGNKQREGAYQQVINYVRKNKINWNCILEAEAEVTYNEDDYILKGTVDLICKRENGVVELVDFKSEKKAELLENRRQLARYYRQLQLYAHLLQKKRGVKIEKVHLYCTPEIVGNSHITFEVNSMSTEKIRKEIDEVIHKILHKEYMNPTMDEEQCKYCDMSYFCKSYKQKNN